MSGVPGRSICSNVKKYVLTGLLTVIPLGLTWVIVEFLLGLLTRIGSPGVRWIAARMQPHVPWLAAALESRWFLTVVAVLFVAFVLYILGWVATRVVGRRLLGFFDALLDRIPLVKSIYGAAKKLIGTFQKKPGEAERVVLIDFPSPEMKTVGLVTREFTDQDTGRKLLAVYVPTTPNPTSGYLEVVPADKVTGTTWSLEEAMTFIVSAGAVAPGSKMNYDRSASRGSEEPN